MAKHIKMLTMESQSNNEFVKHNDASMELQRSFGSLSSTAQSLCTISAYALHNSSCDHQVPRFYQPTRETGVEDLI